MHSLMHEPSPIVRRKAVDTVTDLANGSMIRGRPWHTLQAQSFSMVNSPEAITREAAYRVFTGSPNLIMDLEMDSVLGALQKGLLDPESIEVRIHLALLSSTDPALHFIAPPVYAGKTPLILCIHPLLANEGPSDVQKLHVSQLAT